MTVKDVASALEKRLLLKKAEEYDNVGLLCGQAQRAVTGILISHDTLENVVDEAISTGKNFIVSFHPLIFSGLKSITGKNYVERALLKAIENKIAIFAIHTALDNDYFGVNHRICEALGLENQKVLLPKKNSLRRLDVYVPKEFAGKVKQSLFAAGAGNIGFYSDCSFSVRGKGTFKPKKGAAPFSGQIDQVEEAQEEVVTVIFEHYRLGEILDSMRAAHPYEEVAYQVLALENENQYEGLGRYGELREEMQADEFLQYVKDVFGLKVIRHSGLPAKRIRRVGVLGGSGASGIPAALSVGCDAYLTGDIKYHDFFQGGDKMMVCDIGHYESEQFVVEQIFEILSEIFPKFAISKSTINTNPVNYFL